MLKNTNLKSSFWILTGFVACPCHLPLTMPILLGITAGTALGVFLTNNLWILVVASTMYFLVALLLGIRALGMQAGGQTDAFADNANHEPMDDTRFACCITNEGGSAVAQVGSAENVPGAKAVQT